jgi:hypothetical protein
MNRSLFDMVDEYQQRRQQQEDTALRSVFRAAVETDPKAAADATNIARRLQTTPEQLPDDLDVARAMVKERDFEELKASLTDPLLRERFKDVKFVRLLHDDMGNLKTTIDTFDWWKRNSEAGATINEAGELKARQAFLRHNGSDLPPSDLDRLTEIDEIQRAAEAETGFFDEAAKLVGQMMQPALRATGVGLLAAGVAAPTGIGAGGAFAAASLTAYATQAAVVEFGHQYSTIYEQLTAAGVDPQEAHETALLTGGAYALAAGAVEGLSGGIVGKPFAMAGKMVGRRLLGLARPTVGRAAGTLVRETAQGFTAEVGEEGVQELLGAAAQNIAGQLTGKDTGPSLEEALKAAGEVMLKTAKGMAVLAPIGPAMHFAADTRRVAEAKKAEQLFTRIAENAKNSEVAKRSPDVLKQIVDAKTQGTDLDAVFIAAPRLVEGLRAAGQSREQFAASAPVAAKRLEQAEAEGGDVEIPMGEFAANIAGSDLFPAIQPALRTRYGATIEEAQQFESEREKNQQEAATAVKEARARVADWGAQADRVERRVLGEILANGTNIGSTQARQYAVLHRQFVETQAARSGLTPEQFDETYRVKVQAARPEQAPALNQQSATETPEFRAWFGASKVASNGAPTVVYHGSRRPDRIGNRFRKSRATSGPMAFFTDSPELASSYAMSKADTSIEPPADYAEWFRFKPPGSRSSTVDVNRAWHWLSSEEKDRVRQLAPRVSTNDVTGEIELRPEGHTSGLGGFDYHLREAKGNVLKALVEEWLNSGTLFNHEGEFLDVLRLAGVASAIEFESPWRSNPGVFPVFLSIKNPLDTSAVPASVVEALERASKRQRRPAASLTEAWDKRSREPGPWVAQLKADVASGENSMVWTSIPDWVTKTLQELGYDGIKDRSGKSGVNAERAVWIPFEENQVKSVVNKRPTSRRGLLNQDRPGLYSALRLALDKRFSDPNESKTAKEWDAFFRKLIAEGVIKPSEYFWSGLEDAVKGVDEADATVPFSLVRPDGTTVKSGTAEDVERWKREIPDLGVPGGYEVEENRPTPLTVQELKDLLGEDGGVLVRRVPVMTEGETEVEYTYVASLDGDSVTFDSMGQADRAVEAAIDRELDDTVEDVVSEVGELATPQPWISRPFDSFETWVEKVFRGTREGAIAYGEEGYLKEGELSRLSRMSDEQFAAWAGGLLKDTEQLRNVYDARKEGYESDLTIDADFVAKNPFSVTLNLKGYGFFSHRDLVVSMDNISDLTDEFDGVVIDLNTEEPQELYFSDRDTAEEFVTSVRHALKRYLDRTQTLQEHFFVTEDETEVVVVEPKPGKKYEPWAVPGGHGGYREVVLRIDRQRGKGTSFGALKHTFDDPEADRNQFAHFRYTTRKLFDDDGGGTVMFIDELQSDYADRLRDFGGRQPDTGPKAPQETIDELARVAEDYHVWFANNVSKIGAIRFISAPGFSAPENYNEAVKAMEATLAFQIADGDLSGAAMTRSLIVKARAKKIRAQFERSKKKVTDEALAELKTLDIEAERLRIEAESRSPAAVTDLPFARSTDAWVGLLLKNVLLTAYEEKRELVVFASGAQTASVYSLDKNAKSLSWSFGYVNAKGDVLASWSKATKAVTLQLHSGGSLSFSVNQAGVVEDDPNDVIPVGASLDSVIGKDAANAVMEDWTADSEGKTIDLAESSIVGGVGMRSFYGNADGYQTDVYDRTLFDKNGKPIPAIVPKNVREIAKKIGAEVVKVKVFGVEGENLALRITPEVRRNIAAGFPLFQDDGSPRGSFDPTTNEVFLHPTANATTLLHELSHYWLTTLFRMAGAPQAPEAIRRDAMAVLRWFKIDSLDAWNAMTLDEQRRHHEAWAYNAEAHFFGEGKAPTNDAEQVSMFRAFGRWVRAVYRHARDVLNKQYRRLFGVDLPALTPEVRDVFDRLVASEDAIEAARVDRAMTPLLKEKPSDMTDEDWTLYQRAERDSQDEAVDKLQAASLKSIKWLGNNTARMARKLQAQTRKIRKQVEDEVRKELEAQPVYRAEAQLRHGTMETGEGAVPFKLNLDEFRMLGWVGDRTAEEVESILGVGVSGMLRKGGVPLDVAASMMVGFESGADLVRQLVDAKPIDAAVKELADQRMLAEYSELADPEKVRETIEKALHNEARTKMVAAELRWLTKVTAPIGLMTRAARSYARDVIGRKLVGQVRPHEHAQAEVRNRREAERWLIRGDMSKAASFKRRELLESQLEREALVAREDVQAVEELVKKLAKRDEKLATSRDTDYVAAARFLAATYGMMPGEKSPADYVQKLQAYNPQLAARLAEQLVPARRSPEEAVTWKGLTVDEFRDVKETLEALWNQSLREKQFQLGDAKAKLDDLAAEVVAQDAKLPPPKARPAGFTDRLKQLIARPEHWAHRRDGGEVGVFTRYFWRPVRAAVERYVVDRNRYTKKLADLVTGLQPKLKQGLIEFRDANGKLLHTFGKKNGGFGHSEFVAALLHVGNDSNLKKLLVGRGWGTYDPETKVLDSSAWDAFLTTMTERGYLTKEVMDFVQAVWDLNEEIKPLAQKTHRDLFGFYFKEIEARPLVTQWGNYRGGYVPAKLDEDAASASRVQSLADLEADFRKQFATTGRGFTRERAEDFAEPLSLDLELLPRHVDNVLRFAHIQPAIRDVERLARHESVAAVLDARDPGAWQNMLLPWLQRVASQSITRPGKSKDVDAFWKFVRTSAGISTMFANVANALQQLTGVLTAAMKVKPRYLFHGLGRLLNERGKLYDEIATLSSFMGNRQGRQVFDSIEQIEDVATKKSGLAKARAWVTRHGYFLQSKMQNLVDPIVWAGAYKEARDAMPAGMSDEDANAEAVKRADAAVRMTQSSFDPTDVANYEEGTPFYRIWTMFSGYFNTMANLQADQFVKVSRATGWARAGAAFQLYALGFAAPMLLADAITRTMRGQWDDEDEDGDVDVLTFDFLFLGQLRSAVAEIPVAGPAFIAPALNAFDNQPWNDRMTTSPAVSLLERSFGGTADAVKVLTGLKKDRDGNPVDADGRVIRDPLTLLGFAFGLPLGTLGSRAGYAYDRASGAIDAPGFLGDARALITGTAPRQAR